MMNTGALLIMVVGLKQMTLAAADPAEEIEYRGTLNDQKSALVAGRSFRSSDMRWKKGWGYPTQYPGGFAGSAAIISQWEQFIRIMNLFYPLTNE